MTITPNGKKLIQARLPFKTLATTPKGTDPVGTAESRKRKLSNAEDDSRSIKLSKTSVTTKENIEKTGEVTVQDMVDLVENSNNSSLNDVVMKDNEKVRTIQTKQTKKSTKSKAKDAAVEVGTPRRSSRKHDSEVSTKVVIKIPSSKKKKVSERQGNDRKVNTVLKIDEDDGDDDVIPIDSEENSLTSVDGKEKSPSDKVDLSVILIDDDSSFASDDKGSNSKKNVDEIVNTATSTEGNEVLNTKTVELDNVVNAERLIDVTGESDVSVVQQDTETSNQSDVDNIDSKINVSPISDKAAVMQKTEVITSAVEKEASGEDHDTIANNNLDQSEVVKENILPSSDKAHNMEQDGSDVVCGEKVENLLINMNKKAALENGVEKQVEDKMDTDFDECKVLTPTASSVDRPKRNSIDNSTVMTTPKTPAVKATDNKTLTPKQLQRKLESEQKRLAKEKAKEDRERKLQEAKEERERKLQEEKEQKQRERDEKERQRKKERDDKEEQKRKEREDKEEQRRKEKDEREKKKQAEIDAKNEEKKQKEEEKRQKEEEKRQKEEERIAKEEAEIKKKRKEVEAFTKFFAKKSNKLAETDKMDVDDVEAKLNFMPFRIKDDMRLAPIVRRKLSPTCKTKFDSVVLNSTNNLSTNDLYVQSLRKGNHISEKQGRTWPIEDANDDLMIIGTYFE